MKKSICIYFQIHHPERLRKYQFFDIGKKHNYFDNYANRSELEDLAENCLETTKGLVDIGLNTSYQINVSNFFPLEVSCGVKNLFNQYQNDFDKGAKRDADYIYGPALPRTVFVGLKVKM